MKMKIKMKIIAIIAIIAIFSISNILIAAPKSCQSDHDAERQRKWQNIVLKNKIKNGLIDKELVARHNKEHTKRLAAAMQVAAAINNILNDGRGNKKSKKEKREENWEKLKKQHKQIKKRNISIDDIFRQQGIDPNTGLPED